MKNSFAFELTGLIVYLSAITTVYLSVEVLLTLII